jgi:hypothetical protein
MTTWPSLSASLYIAGQLLRLNNSISEDDKPTELSRYSGGHTRATQPHLTGFHQVLFYLPETLFATFGSDAQKWLQMTCESFTPHSYTINMGDVSGIGQVGVSYPLSRTTNREFTLGFREFRNLPILSIIKMWQSLFDPLIGTSPFGSLGLTPLSYKGVVIVANLKPTADSGSITTDDLEEAYIYEGVFPTNCPEDNVTSSDQATIDTSLASVTFKFDGAPLDMGFPGVAEVVVSSFSGYNYNNVYNFVGKI